MLEGDTNSCDSWIWQAACWQLDVGTSHVQSLFGARNSWSPMESYGVLKVSFKVKTRSNTKWFKGFVFSRRHQGFRPPVNAKALALLTAEEAMKVQAFCADIAVANMTQCHTSILRKSRREITTVQYLPICNEYVH